MFRLPLSASLPPGPGPHRRFPAVPRKSTVKELLMLKRQVSEAAVEREGWPEEGVDQSTQECDNNNKVEVVSQTRLIPGRQRCEEHPGASA